MKNFEYAKNKKRIIKMPTIETNNYSIPLWALPIAPFIIAYDKFDKWNYKRQNWDEKKATKVLNYFLPYVIEYDKEKQAYYYCMDWRYRGSDIAKKVPIGLKKWTKKFGFETLNYLENTYEKTDFLKTIEKDYNGTWIKFEKRY